MRSEKMQSLLRVGFKVSQYCLGHSTLLLEWLLLIEYLHPFAMIMKSESDIQLCLTLCDPMDYTAHGILQARLLEWVTQGSNPGLLHCKIINIAY